MKPVPINVILYSQKFLYWDSYRYGGNYTRSGIDCSAFGLSHLFYSVGINIPRKPSSHPKWARKKYQKECKSSRRDLLFFRGPEEKLETSHSLRGIVTEATQKLIFDLFHSSTSLGVSSGITWAINYWAKSIFVCKAYLDWIPDQFFWLSSKKIYSSKIQGMIGLCFQNILAY